MVDGIVVVLSLVFTFSIGLYLSRRQRNVGDYYLANHRMSYWLIALSIVATQISGISYLGMPAFIFQKDLTILLRSFTVLIAQIVIAFTLAPLFFRLKLTSIYEYFELRFNVTVRVMATLIMLAAKLAWLAMVIYASGLLMSVQFNIQLKPCVIGVGLFTTLYTCWGGIKADIYTDAIQFLIMTVGLFVTVGMILWHFHGDVSGIWNIAESAGRTTIIRDVTDLNTEYSFGAILIGMLIINLFDYGGNQITVQRYLTAHSSRDTVKSLLLSASVTLPMVILLGAVGIGLYSFYSENPVLMQSLSADSPGAPQGGMDRVFAHFIANVIPPGLSGLVTAAVLAAGLSSADSGFNSLSAICFVDYYKRFIRRSSRGDAADLRLARYFSIFWGLVSTALALYINEAGILMEVANKMYSYCVGPLIALFFLGLYTRFISGSGAVLGVVCGCTTVAIVAYTTPVHFLWYAPFGCIATILSASLVSCLKMKRQAALE